jgi:hypothetical protein
MPLFPCKHNNVYALLLLPDGSSYVGQNLRLNDSPTCPRGDSAPSTNYDICTTVCNTVGHAEYVAIMAALFRRETADLRGGKMWIFGHNYQCENCRTMCEHYGITVVSITDLGDTTCQITV